MISLLGKLYPQSKESVVQLESEFAEKLAQLDALKAKESEIKAAKNVIEAEIKQAMADNEMGIVGDWKVTWKSSSRSTFSSDDAKQYLTQEQIDACTHTSTVRTMRISKSKKKSAAKK